MFRPLFTRRNIVEETSEWEKKMARHIMNGNIFHDTNGKKSAGGRRRDAPNTLQIAYLSTNANPNTPLSSKGRKHVCLTRVRNGEEMVKKWCHFVPGVTS